MQTRIFIIFSLLLSSIFCNSPLKPHEVWWEACVDDQISYEYFEWSLGEVNCLSRRVMREHVIEMGYTSILDVPSALCLDYFGFLQENYPIEYLGVDITPKFISFAESKGIPAIQGSIENLPLEDNSFEICYARHILEHLKSYEKAVDELIRVAKKEVLIIFFMIPDNSPNLQLETHDGYLIYHNTYSREELEKYVRRNPKVHCIDWEHFLIDFPRIESILHLYLCSETESEDP